jgi:hypothetical protein
MATVLIVEDDFVLAYTLDQALTKAGHVVVGRAPRFEDAVEIAAVRPPEIALVDYRLKGPRDGVAVAEHLRKLGTHIIYVTADPTRSGWSMAQPRSCRSHTTRTSWCGQSSTSSGLHSGPGKPEARKPSPTHESTATMEPAISSSDPDGGAPSHS